MPPAETYQIGPVEGGRWMIITSWGQPVLANQDFATREVALDALAEWLRKQGRSFIMETQMEGAQVTATILDPASVRFSVDSLRGVDEINTAVGDALRRRAVERATRSGRLRVTDDDVLAAAPDALADVARDIAARLGR